MRSLRRRRQATEILATNREEIYAAGQHLATYTDGTTYFDHADWLGTERARSNVSGAQTVIRAHVME